MNCAQVGVATMSNLRELPSVDQLLQSSPILEQIERYGRPLTLNATRAVLDEIRKQFQQNQESIPTVAEILIRIDRQLMNWTTPSLKPVINASGVILHTNLGRAPLSHETLQAIQEVAIGYSNLEYDLTKGQRGSRLIHAEKLLQRLTGAEATLVVNNNAAAVMLVLSALARRKFVVIARSQLVEIGGGFRIPDVMKQSGAKLLEIGTTNRVHLSDYQIALEEPGVALVMRAHRSNFQIIGFTSEPSLLDISQIARNASIPVVDDLGSGALLDTSQYGLGHEPTIQDSLAAGADLVCFSGDKLLGGPQAGIILGRADLVARLRKHPLARAIRADKLCLAGLSATLSHYLKDEADCKIPVWRMISTHLTSLQERACSWQAALQQGEIISTQSTVGGGSLPHETLPTSALYLKVTKPNRLLELLRQHSTPIIARIESEGVVLDPRTVLPEQDNDLLNGIQQALRFLSERIIS